MRHWSVGSSAESIVRSAMEYLACAVVMAAVLAQSALAQDPPYPKRANIEMTVLFPAGTSADITARLLAQGMAKRLTIREIQIDPAQSERGDEASCVHDVDAAGHRAVAPA